MHDKVQLENVAKDDVGRIVQSAIDRDGVTSVTAKVDSSDGATWTISWSVPASSRP